MTWNALTLELRKLSPGGHSGPQMVIMQDVQTVPGDYEDTFGSIVQDRSRKYTVALPERRIQELRQMLRRAANTFDQECIYLAVRGDVEFVRATPADGYLGECL